jgi:hypothetical protein
MEKEPAGGRLLHILILWPNVTPDAIDVPARCAFAGESKQIWSLYQNVAKPLPDTGSQKVQVHRAPCVMCTRTFWVSPQGTTYTQTLPCGKGLAAIRRGDGLGHSLSHEKPAGSLYARVSKPRARSGERRPWSSADADGFKTVADKVVNLAPQAHRNRTCPTPATCDS